MNNNQSSGVKALICLGMVVGGLLGLCSLDSKTSSDNNSRSTQKNKYASDDVDDVKIILP